MALAVKTMESAVLTTTDDDIVVPNGISSDSDSSSECETDKGDNAGYDKECPSILILALEHAIAACKTLEGESLMKLQYAMTLAQALDVELRTAVADSLEELQESARLNDVIANEAVDKLVFDYVHTCQRERFRKRGRVFDIVDSVDGPWGRKLARSCPLDLCYYRSISDKELIFVDWACASRGAARKRKRHAYV